MSQNCKFDTGLYLGSSDKCPKIFKCSCQADTRQAYTVDNKLNLWMHRFQTKYMERAH